MQINPSAEFSRRDDPRSIGGIVLFVGVLTDRSRAIWPSVLAHGAWNGIVAKAYYASISGEAIPTCTDAGCRTSPATTTCSPGRRTSRASSVGSQQSPRCSCAWPPAGGTCGTQSEPQPR